MIPSLARRYGGPSQAAIHMCRALTDHGQVHTEIVTTDADGPGRLDVPIRNLTAYSGVPCRFFARHGGESLKLSRGLTRWVEAHVSEFDLVHIHAVFSHTTVAAGRSCRRHGVPYLVRPLGTLDPWSLRQKRKRKWLFWELFAKRLVRQADAVHYTSAAEKTRAEAHLDLHGGRVLPLGVDVNGLRHEAAAGAVPADLAGSPYLIALGRLHPKKNLEALIDAFTAVARGPALARWKLVLAGSGDSEHERRLREVAGRAPAGTVRFTGWVDGAEKAALLANASLKVLPSFQENFGIAVIEALALGTPALVSPGVDLAVEIEQAGAGWIANPDRDDLSAALQTALSDPDELARRGQRALAYAEALDWTKVAGRLVDLYREVTRRS